MSQINIHILNVRSLQLMTNIQFLYQMAPYVQRKRKRGVYDFLSKNGGYLLLSEASIRTWLHDIFIQYSSARKLLSFYQYQYEYGMNYGMKISPRCTTFTETNKT